MMVDTLTNMRNGNRAGRVDAAASGNGVYHHQNQHQANGGRGSQPYTQTNVTGLYSSSSIAMMKELQNAARKGEHERQRAFEGFQQALIANALNGLSDSASFSTINFYSADSVRLAIESNRHVAAWFSQPVPSLLRLSIACPFDDVRVSCAAFLEALAQAGVRVPKPVHEVASFFIPAEQIALERLCSEEPANELLEGKFLQTGRLENYVQVLALHPSYLEVFLRTHSHLFYADDLPLRPTDRHYIAMMASARYNCSYLVNLHATEFLLNNGDENWLRGLEHIPKKLRDLFELNKLLAHRPWLITASHIEHLLSNENSFRWSLSELVHAIVLLAHIHALCSFVYSSGVSAELDQTAGHTYRRPSGDSGSESGACNADTNPSRMDKRSACGPCDEANNNINNGSNGGAATTGSAKVKKSVSFSTSYSPTVFNDEPTFGYVECGRRRSSQSSFREHSFVIESRTWDNALSMIGSLCSDSLSESIEARINTACELTYNTRGDQMDVDTSAFRRAIWNTVHMFYGVQHEDYDYADAHRHLDRGLRSWVKIVACFPERVTEKAYRNVLQSLRDTEKVHVNLMVLEARMQAALLYALRAIQDYRKR